MVELQTQNIHAAQDRFGRPVAQKQDLGDLQTFLKMLTTQMQNQDPMEPMKSSDFAAQLASFSAVEQQVQTNALLSAMSDRLGLADLGSWLGQDVLHTLPVQARGAALTLVLPEGSGAGAAFVVAKDAAGNEVGRFPVAKEARRMSFDVSVFGDRVQPGSFYTLSRAEFEEDRVVSEDPVMTYARVTESRVEDGKPLVVLETGQSISVEDIFGVRDPGSIREGS